MKPVPFFTIIRKIQKVCHPQGYRMTYYEEKDGYVHIAMEKNNDVRIQPVWDLLDEWKKDFSGQHWSGWVWRIFAFLRQKLQRQLHFWSAVLQIVVEGISWLELQKERIEVKENE